MIKLYAMQCYENKQTWIKKHMMEGRPLIKYLADDLQFVSWRLFWSSPFINTSKTTTIPYNFRSNAHLWKTCLFFTTVIYNRLPHLFIFGVTNVIKVSDIFLFPFCHYWVLLRWKKCVLILTVCCEFNWGLDSVVG